MQECNAQFALGKDFGSQKTASLMKCLQFEGGGLRQYEVVILKPLRAGVHERLEMIAARDQTRKFCRLSKSVSISVLCRVLPPLLTTMQPDDAEAGLKKSQIE